jgi:hypothetical protein
MNGRTYTVLAALVILLATSNMQAATPIATLVLHSQPGDFIGQGGTFNEVYPQPGDPHPAIAPAIGPRVNGLPAWIFFVLGGTNNVTDLLATVNIATNQLGVPLEPGTYLNAQRAPDATPGHPGLNIEFDSRGCDVITGNFTVTDAVYAADGTVSSLAFSFEQHCEGAMPALFGTFTYNANATVIPQPTLTVNRTKLNFGYSGALITTPQTVTVNITGGTNVGWIASSDHPNVTLSPASGTGSGTFQVTATPPSGGGSSNAVITVSAGGATGSPQQIQVSVNSVVPATPFGSFDTPTNNLTGIAGAIGVTGWALDNIEITNVRIYREPPPGQGGPLAFIGDAVFVADARPDVAATFPGSPYPYRAGWGYQMLTNFLPNGSGSGPLGSGTYNIHALATNANGTMTDLGTRTITVDNAHASKPFGTIDTPAQGGTATGSGFVNYGWALTQNPFIIPTDGSTITVFLDGTPTGHPTYNQSRSDIATLFPGYLNSNGAVGFFFIDTTKLQNKIHTISWSVTDNGARVDGIGSRYFNVFNAGGGVVAAPEEPPTPESLAGPVQLRSGYDLKAPAVALTADDTGAYSVEMEQFGRIELSLGATKGYQIVGYEAAELPLGSTLKAGVFYWQPPLGFFGQYELLFEREDGSQFRVRVSIVPKKYSVQ